MLCTKCYFYDCKSKGCAVRYNMPAEKEKCYYFEPEVDVSLSQAEIWAIMDVLIYVKGRKDPTLNCSYNKLRKIAFPQVGTHKLKSQDHISLAV